MIIQFLVEDLVGKDYEQYLSNVDKIRELLGKPENDIEYGEDQCETVTCIDYIDELHRPNNTAGLVIFLKIILWFFIIIFRWTHGTRTTMGQKGVQSVKQHKKNPLPHSF